MLEALLKACSKIHSDLRYFEHSPPERPHTTWCLLISGSMGVDVNQDTPRPAAPPPLLIEFIRKGFSRAVKVLLSGPNSVPPHPNKLSDEVQRPLFHDTPLHIALTKLDKDACRLLIECGARLFQPNEQGLRPIQMLHASYTQPQVITQDDKRELLEVARSVNRGFINGAILGLDSWISNPPSPISLSLQPQARHGLFLDDSIDTPSVWVFHMWHTLPDEALCLIMSHVTGVRIYPMAFFHRRWEFRRLRGRAIAAPSSH
jgi:hypothetical protein